MDRLLAGRGDLNALRTAVVGVRDTCHETGLLQLLHLPGDVGRLHGKPGRQFAGAHGLGVGDLPQQRRGRTVQRHSGQRHQPVVLPDASGQVGDATQSSLDLQHGGRDGDVCGRRCGHTPSLASDCLSQVILQPFA